MLHDGGVIPAMLLIAPNPFPSTLQPPPPMPYAPTPQQSRADKPYKWASTSSRILTPTTVGLPPPT